MYIYVYLVKNKTWHPSKQRQPWNQVNVTRRAPPRRHHCLEIALVEPTPELPNEQLLPVHLWGNQARPRHAVRRHASHLSLHSDSLSKKCLGAKGVRHKQQYDVYKHHKIRFKDVYKDTHLTKRYKMHKT